MAGKDESERKINKIIDAVLYLGSRRDLASRLVLPIIKESEDTPSETMESILTQW